MPVRSHVEVVRRIPLQVHPTRVPVPLFGHALRGPVRPDPELRVAEPVWRDVLFERFPRGLKRTGGDRPRLPNRGGSRCIGESARSKCERERGRESLHQSTASEHYVSPWIKIVEPQRLARVRQILTFFLGLNALHGREAYAIQVRLDLSDPLKLDCKVLSALVDRLANRVELGAGDR